MEALIEHVDNEIIKNKTSGGDSYDGHDYIEL